MCFDLFCFFENLLKEDYVAKQRDFQPVVVMRVYRAFPFTEENEVRAKREFDAMCAAAMHLMSVGLPHMVFSVLEGTHPDQDRWFTNLELEMRFDNNPHVRHSAHVGDPFFSQLDSLIDPLCDTGFHQMLSVSYTSAHLVTQEVVLAMKTAFEEHGARSVAVVPPDMPTGLRGAANNQCMAWDLKSLADVGGFDPRDEKPHTFNIQGVGEIIPALKMGPGTQAVLIPNVLKGDTRNTPAQEEKRQNKERRITEWLMRDHYTWKDLHDLIMWGYPRDLRTLP
jgi:hypothetical protein